MKVRVLERFVGKGRIIVYPGEVIDMPGLQVRKLMQRGLVEPVDGQIPTFDEELGEPGWTRKKPCCP